MGKLIDLTGKVFDRWTVLEKAGTNSQKRVEWLCRCDCGTTRKVIGKHLRERKSRSCGCYDFQNDREKPRKNSGRFVNGKPTSEYSSWQGLKQRCSNPNDHSYLNYGKRGITYCARWELFENFLEDMGERPDPSYTLERLDNNGNYEPSNCRWESKTRQSRNRRVLKSNASGVSGVRSRNHGKVWEADITVDYKRVYLGRFETLEEATQARMESEYVYWGKIYSK